MANDVFANGREISCKKADGKSICAFPDVCFTPPENPATPPGVPIPYPNTGMAKDTTSGSKKVKISGKEAMLKNKSHFKKSMGDEAGCAAKKGVLTSTNRGKVYFTMWSMDVKFEGKNVVRHLDMTTHNHMSTPGNTPPWPYMDSMAASKDPCMADKQKEKDACSDYKKPDGEDGACKAAGLSGKLVQKNKDAGSYGTAAKWADAKTKKANANDCIRARRCKLTPYKAKKDGVNGCCPSQTPDHVIPKSSFFESSFAGGKGAKLPGWKDYDYKTAPCMCLEGASNTAGNHGLRHAHHKAFGPDKGTRESFNKQAKRCAESAAAVSGCDAKCIEAQLKQGHSGDKRSKVKHSSSGSKISQSEISKRCSPLNPTTTLN
ncbi:MAG: PAAR-like domain-containing protein [Planctomycetaceae bacterium]